MCACQWEEWQKVRMRVPAAEWGEMGPMQYMYQRLGEYCYDQVGAAQCVLVNQLD